MKILLRSGRGAAFTLPEALFVAVIVIVLFLIYLVPTLTGATQSKSDRIRCVNNLKHIGLAFRIFGSINGGKYPMQVGTNAATASVQGSDLELTQYLKSLATQLSDPKLLLCPADKNRQPVANFWQLSSSNVSYFLGLDSSEAATGSLLAGDRNIAVNGRTVERKVVAITTNDSVAWTEEIHKLQGNVLLGDGSVQMVNNTSLPGKIKTSGALTNRLAFP